MKKLGVRVVAVRGDSAPYERLVLLGAANCHSRVLRMYFFSFACVGSLTETFFSSVKATLLPSAVLMTLSDMVQFFALAMVPAVWASMSRWSSLKLTSGALG